MSQAWHGSSGVTLFLTFLFLLLSCTMCGWAARRCLEATLRVSRALARTFLPFGAGPACRGQSCNATWRIFRNSLVYYFQKIFFSEILERCTPCFVRVFIFKHIVSPGTCLRIAFHLDKFAHVTQNSSQIVFSYNVTFRIYSQNSISLHPAGRFQLQFVSLRSTTI